MSFNDTKLPGDDITSQDYDDTLDYMASLCKWRIYKKNGLYYARTADRDVTAPDPDADATTVIQGAIDALESDEDGWKGGILHLQGRFPVDSIEINKPNIILEGEGRATELIPLDSSVEELIKVYTPAGASPDTHANVVRDLCFYNPYWESYHDVKAIYYHNNMAGAFGIPWPTVDNCWFIRINGITSDTTGFDDWNHQVLKALHVSNCVFDHSPDYGIIVYNAMDGWIENTYIVHEEGSVASEVGVEINCSPHPFSSGWFLDNVVIVRAQTGLKYVEGDDGWFTNLVSDLCVDYAAHLDTVNRAHLTNCHFTTGSVSSGTGLYLEDSYDTRVIGCTIRDCLRGVHSADYVDADHYNFFSNTISEACGTNWYNINAVDKFTKCNYITENHGSSTGTGAQQTIAHGCSFTPTEDEVYLSERTTGGALAKQTAAPDATNIYITATGAKDYNWSVDKE